MSARLTTSELAVLPGLVALGWISSKDAETAKRWSSPASRNATDWPTPNRLPEHPSKSELRKIVNELELAIEIARRELADLQKLETPKRELLTELIKELDPAIDAKQRDALVRELANKDRAIPLKLSQIEALEHKLRDPMLVFRERQVRSLALADQRRKEREESDAFFARLASGAGETAEPDGRLLKVNPSDEQRIRSAIELMQRLESCSRALKRRAVSGRRIIPEPLSELDIKLAREWVGIESDHTGSESEWLFCKMLSARTAERIAFDYYHRLGLAPVDVSSAQIDGTPRDWRTHDLSTASGPVDVKNARQSFHSPEHYVEHSVPRFKLERSTSSEVKICGVLSPYKADRNYYLQETPEALILGEASATEITQIFHWLGNRFGTTLDLSRGWRTNYIAGWQFEYQAQHYQGREEQIDLIAKVLAEVVENGLPTDKLPGWALVLGGTKLAEDVRSLILDSADERQKELLPQLWLLSDQVGLSRQSLSLFAMGIAVESVIVDRSDQGKLSVLRTLLGTGTERSPSSVLWLDDALQYVMKLIALLERVVNWLLSSDLKVMRFRLAHPAILQGLKEDGEWCTLLAYCGGWQRRPVRARCGKAPLFVGMHEHCPSCGRLVCDNCGFCGNACELCDGRQDAFAHDLAPEDFDPDLM